MGTIMREYETMYILHPELTADQNEKLRDRVKEVIAKQGGELLREDTWGKKKLAYRSKKQSRGDYHFVHFVGQPEIVFEVERFMRNQEHVIRFLTSVMGEVTDLEAKKAEVERLVREQAEQAKRIEAERVAAEAAAAAEAEAAAAANAAPAEAQASE